MKKKMSKAQIAEYIFDEYFRRNKIKVPKDTRLMYRYGNQEVYCGVLRSGAG